MCLSRDNLVIENLALRQQIAALKKERPQPALDDADRGFCVALRTAWPRWANHLVILQADTVAKWNRDRFRRHWARISQQQHRPGRPRVDIEVRHLIKQMALDGWGAPRNHGELMKHGFVVSEATVSGYMPRRPVKPDQVKRRLAFLHNRKQAIVATDFFTVPTASRGLLDAFFVIDYDRRPVVHLNATVNSTAAWVIQQLREAFPDNTAPKYLILDCDAIFRPEIMRFIKAMGTTPRHIGYRSPWQSPVAEQ